MDPGESEVVKAGVGVGVGFGSQNYGVPIGYNIRRKSTPGALSIM